MSALVQVDEKAISSYNLENDILTPDALEFLRSLDCSIGGLRSLARRNGRWSSTL